MTRKSLATDIELTNSLAWFSCGAWLIVGMSTACRLRLYGKTDDIASCGNPSHSFHPGYEYKAASLISVTAPPPWGKVRATRLLSGSWLAPVNQPLDFIPCFVPTFGIPRIGVFIVELVSVRLLNVDLRVYDRSGCFSWLLQTRSSTKQRQNVDGSWRKLRCILLGYDGVLNTFTGQAYWI